MSTGIPGVSVIQGTLPFESDTSRMAPCPFGKSRLTVGTPMTMLHAGRCSDIREGPTGARTAVRVDDTGRSLTA